MNESIETSENEAVTPMTAERIISMIHPDIPPATAHFLLNEAKPLLVELEQLKAQGGSQHKGANMIDNNELISTLRERAALYAYGSADSMACTAAASLLEAQACEIERHDIEYSVRGLLLLDTERERDILRAQLAALQCEDELPEAEYAWRGSFDAGHWTDIRDKDCTLLYTADQLRQAQAMVRAKMVAATVAPAQPAQSAPAKGVPEGWQPIETAPKWKNVLLFSIRYGSIFIDDWALYCTTNHPQITHWMPLPAVPQQEQKGGE